MNETVRHTPGPWVWSPHDGYPSTDLIGGDGSDVLQIYESHGGGYMPNKSNARLIAAAPEMLEVLLEAVDRNLAVEDADWWGRVYAAIDKATGNNDAR